MPSAEKPLTVKPLTVMPSAEKPLAVIKPSAEKQTEQKKVENTISRSYLAVGWLVCTRGPEYGYTYHLFEGKNKVCGCLITYDEQKNRFYLMAENSSRVQLNGIGLFGFEMIQTGDEICVGENQFEFIAYCRGRRKWNPILQNGEQNGGMG